MSILLDASEPPTIIFDDNYVGARIPALIGFNVIGNESLSPAFTLSCELAASTQISRWQIHLRSSARTCDIVSTTISATQRTSRFVSRGVRYTILLVKV